MSVTIPIEGSNVKQGVNYVKTPDGQVMPAGGQTTNAPAPPPPGAQAGQTPGQAAETTAPAAPLTPLQQFHPSLDPAKVTMTWDEATGKVKIAPIAEAEAETAAGGDEAAGEGQDLPALGEQHHEIPGGSQEATQAGQGADVVAELRGQLGQMTQLVTAMAQAQLSGKPLGEVLGLSAPAQVEPDYSSLDLYDPAQLANFIKQSVGSAINGAMTPYQGTIENARRRQEYDAVALQFGHEADFRQKSVAAIQLVAENPALTIEQAYATINKISQTLAPKQTAPAAAATQPAANNATRTLTAEQAAQKAEQAKRLPGNSGVRGAGKPEMPSHITGLGQMIAWNLQQASQGN